MLDPGERVVMLRNHLRRISPEVLPRSYQLRPFRDGDEQAWVRIQSASDCYNPITPDLFESEFEGRNGDLKERQLYVVDEHGEEVGTATAWFPQAGIDPNCGRLHWLAVVPNRRRQGLGGALVAAVLTRLRQLGYERAYLTSSSVRQDALKLYERFEFRTVPAEPRPGTRLRSSST